MQRILSDCPYIDPFGAWCYNAGVNIFQAILVKVGYYRQGSNQITTLPTDEFPDGKDADFVGHYQIA